MALTAELRRGIDSIRNYLFGGGYPDPLGNAEQLSYLFFFYLLEGIDADNELKARDKAGIHQRLCRRLDDQEPAKLPRQKADHCSGDATEVEHLGAGYDWRRLGSLGS